MPQNLPAVIPGAGPVEDAKIRSYPVSGPIPGTGRTGYTPNWTIPEAAPSPGWFKRTASALRDGASGVADKAAGFAGSATNSLRGALSGDALKAAAPALKSALPAAATVAGEVPDIYKVGENGTGMDVATQYAESAGKLGSMALGAQTGAALGALGGPLAPVTVPVGTVLGGAAGYWAGGKAIEGGRKLAGLDSRPVAERVSDPASAPTAAGPTADPRLQNPGRGVGFDDPRRLDMDNTRGSLRESRNFGPELASVPAQLPDNLRQGVVFKTKDASGRTVYSGKNVSGDIQVVDGMGATQPARGGFAVVPGGPATGLSGAGQGVALGGALASAQQPMQTEPAGFNTGRNGNAFERSPEQMRADAMTQEGSIDTRTRTRGLRTLDSLDKSDASQLAAQTARYGADQALRGQGLAADASRYGADRKLQGDLAQAEATSSRYSMEQRVKANQMLIQAQAMKLAKGDTRLAAQYMLQMGGDPSNLTQAATAFQGIDGKNRSDAEAYLDSVSAVPDKDGNPVINPALRAQNAQMLNTITGGRWAQADATERAQLAPDAIAGLRLVQGMNQYRGAGWGNLLAKDKPAYAGLPQNLAGGRLERVGLGEGAVSKDIGRGDYVLRTPDGQEIYVPQAAVDGTTLRMLEKRGVTLKLD